MTRLNSVDFEISDWKKFQQNRLSRTPEIGFLENVWKIFPQN